MQLCCVSFNSLADAYIGYGNYHRTDSSLLLPGARIPHTLKLIADLEVSYGVDVICLQEVDLRLRAKLRAPRKWQTFWSQKRGGMYDGCLTLVRSGIAAKDHVTHHYSEGSGHVAQFITIEGLRFVNTHIKYAPADARPHCGIVQTKELLKWLGPKQPAVICADGNDRLNGPIRALIRAAGFANTCEKPTALIGEERASIDLIAARGVRATAISTTFQVEDIPSTKCPSDHIPVMARVETE